MNTTGKVLVGVLAGAACGAILGVLFAPDKGTETRRKIAQRGKNIRDDVKEKITDILGTAKERMERKESQDQTQKEKSRSEMA